MIADFAALLRRLDGWPGDCMACLCVLMLTGSFLVALVAFN